VLISPASAQVSGAASQGDAEANRLFVEAVGRYQAIPEGPDAGVALGEVRTLVERIIAEYPDTLPGRSLAAGGVVAGIDLDRLRALPAIPPEAGWGPATEELVAVYGADFIRLNAIADAADRALLAWAAYGDAEALELAATEGWTPMQNFSGDRVLVGDAAATLFRHEDGKSVLAFRGTTQTRDWVTNGASISIVPLLTGQVRDALRIAAEVDRDHPGVEFAGHSLGGRLAQAASLRTGGTAYAFNSAPVGYAEIAAFGHENLVNGTMRRFRGPQDDLSSFFTPSDIEVSNAPRAGILEFGEKHSIEALARAMLAVRDARSGALAARVAGEGSGAIVPTMPPPPLPGTGMPQSTPPVASGIAPEVPPQFEAPGPGDTATAVFGMPLTAGRLAAIATQSTGRWAAICAEPNTVASGLPCPFVHRDACQGEGCITRGPILAEIDVPLHAFPGSTEMVGPGLRAGDWAFAEYAEVWLAPCRVRVSSNNATELPGAGSIHWRLRYEGEGFSRYWSPQTGSFSRDDSEFDTFGAQAGWDDDPCNGANRQVWRLLTTADGQRGWTSEARGLAGLDRYAGYDLMDRAPGWMRALAAAPPIPQSAVYEAVLTQGSVAEAPPPAPVTGDWVVRPEADAMLAMGEATGRVALGADHAVTVDGVPLLGPLSLAVPSQAHLFHSPTGHATLILQRYPASWGFRAAVIGPDVPFGTGTDLLLPDQMRGTPSARDVRELVWPVAWSPDGRFAALAVSRNDHEQHLALIDLQTGAHAVVVPEGPVQDTVGSVRIETLENRGDGTHAIMADMSVCRDVACTTAAPASSIQIVFALPAPAPSGLAGFAEAIGATDPGNLQDAGPLQVAMFDALPDGLYAVDPDSCDLTEDNVGDAWGVFFRLLDRPKARTGYYGDCTIVGRSDSGDAVAIDWSCSGEDGEVRTSTTLWRVSGPESFTDLNVDGLANEFVYCSDPRSNGPDAQVDEWPTAELYAEEGSGVSLLNFWASWCAPCQAELPMLSRLAAEGLVVDGINVRDTTAGLSQGLDERPDQSTIFDPEGTIAAGFGVSDLPATLVRDAQGRVVARHHGPLTEASYRATILPAIAPNALRLGGTTIEGPPPSSSSIGQADPADTVPGVPAGIIDLTDAPGRIIAAALRSGGVTAEHTRVTDGPTDDAEIDRLAAGYRAAPPVLRTPALPAATDGHDSETGALTLCMQSRLTIPADRVAFADGGWQPSVILEQQVPFDNPFQAMCTMPHRDRIAAEEALHGTGDLARYDIDGRVNSSLHLHADAAAQAILDSASEAGTLRVTAECRIAFRELLPGQSSRYDYREMGTCVLDRLTFSALDRNAEVIHRIAFRADGAAFVPEGAPVTEPLPTRAVPEAMVAQTARAPRTFEANDTDEAAVRAIIEGFAGQPAEVLLGYRNAFPFRTEASRELAVAVFGQLPPDEIDTVAGTERGYSSFVVKSWSDLNRHWFPDDPAPGLGSAVLGRIEDLRILSLEAVSGTCEWRATYRIWLAEPTPFGTALSAVSGRDGLTFRACLRTTRTGFDLVEQAFVD
jgi:thiol-disulfide isomerase/thioredoxin